MKLSGGGSWREGAFYFLSLASSPPGAIELLIFTLLAFWQAFKKKIDWFGQVFFRFWLRMIEELWWLVLANGFPNIQQEQ